MQNTYSGAEATLELQAERIVALLKANGLNDEMAVGEISDILYFMNKAINAMKVNA